MCNVRILCHARVTDVLHVTCMTGSHDLHVILAFWVMWFACDLSFLGHVVCMW